MIRKTIEFATMGTRLSVAHHQLVVERPEVPKATLPIEDLGVVIVDDARATYTQAVFLELLAAGATVMVTGRDHLPAGMMLPLAAHHVQTERHRAQVEANLPTKKRIWQALIAAKIAQQGAVLDNFTGHHGGLLPLAKRVRSGDPDNLEAQAAQRYWPGLFGKDFRRDRRPDGINAALNYGCGHAGRNRPRRRGLGTDPLVRGFPQQSLESILSRRRSAWTLPPLCRLACPPSGERDRR
jgi:CRISP-associated protein Cas1